MVIPHVRMTSRTVCASSGSALSVTTSWFQREFFYLFFVVYGSTNAGSSNRTVHGRCRWLSGSGFKGRVSALYLRLGHFSWL